MGTTTRKRDRARAQERPGNRAVIVTRISDDRGEDRVGHETQEAGCRAKAAALGLEVVAVYADDIGGDRIDRPGLMAALLDIAEGRADVLMTYAVDRLARDVGLQFGIIGQARAAGGRYLSAKDDVPAGPMGDAIMAMLAAGAAMELASIRERVGRAMKARYRDAGRYKHNERPPFGYERVEGPDGPAYRPHPVNAPVLVRIWTEAAAGRSVARIVAGLNADGIPASKGGPWNTSSVSRLLNDGLLYGRGIRECWRRGTRRLAEDGNRPTAYRRPVEERYRVEGLFPPLVPADLVERANEAKARNVYATRRSDRSPEVGTLRYGFVLCAACGRAMTLTTDAAGRANYACKQRVEHNWRCPGGAKIAQPALDEAVRRWVLTVLEDPAQAARFRTERGPVEPDPALVADLAEAEREVARLSGEVERLVENLSLVKGAAARIAADRLNRQGEALAAAEARRDGIAGRIAADRRDEERLALAVEPGAVWQAALAAVEAMRAAAPDPDPERILPLLVRPVPGMRLTHTSLGPWVEIDGEMEALRLPVPDTHAAWQAAFSALGLSVRVRRSTDEGPRWEAVIRVQAQQVYSSRPTSSAARGRTATHGRPG